MPIYEFRCQKCGHDFELVRSVARMEEPAPCPACKSKRTERRISMFAVARGADPDIMASDDIDPADLPGMGGDDWGDDDWDDDF